MRLLMWWNRQANAALQFDRSAEAMDLEVVIVGAGAAGIGAGRHLANHGHEVVLIEAMSRCGGRAHTVTTQGMPLDLGCGWLHSAERNPLVGIAEPAGFTVDRSEAAWGKQLRNLGLPEADQHAARQAYAAFERALRGEVVDDVASNAVPPSERWRPYLDMVSGALNGAELDRVSARDLLAYDQNASKNDWRLPRGYGTLFADLARPLHVRLGCRVQQIRHDAKQIEVVTDAGTLKATAAIVTVATNVLAQQAIGFNPEIDEHLHAASCLPLGQVEKLFLAITDADAVPPESHLVGNFDRAMTGSYYIRPFGLPVIECFFGGIAARAIQSLDQAGRKAFAVEELSALLGRKFADGLTLIAESAWHVESTIGGAYSHALPGHSEQRAKLATPADQRLYFAGEACSPHDFSTAHGAWASGVAAARQVEAFLRCSVC